MSYSYPTTGDKGILYRSRLEAKWSHIFNRIGWKYSYEPFDLKGYIPDFLVDDGITNFLIEIKGVLDIWNNNKQHLEKAIQSGYKGLILFIGADYKMTNENCVNIGIGYNTKSLKCCNVFLYKSNDKWMSNMYKLECEKIDDFESIYSNATNKVQYKGTYIEDSDDEKELLDCSNNCGRKIKKITKMNGTYFRQCEFCRKSKRNYGKKNEMTLKKLMNNKTMVE